MRRLSIVLLLFFLLPLCLSAQQAGQRLQTASEIRTLPRKTAHQELPVTLNGVVTYVAISGRGDGVDPIEGFILQDHTAGIYVAWPPSLNPRLPLVTEGDRLDVSGTTRPGGFAPSVTLSSFAVAGKSPVPVGPQTTLPELLTGRYDCQPVTIEGVVQRMEINSLNIAQIELAAESGVFPVFVNQARALPQTNLVDFKLRVSGICFSSYNSRGELNGIQIRLPSASGVQILEAGNPDPFSAPEASPLALLPFQSEPTNLHRQRLTGVVSLARDGEYFYIRSAERCFRVESHQKGTLVPGDKIEASGFVAKSSGFGMLREAVFRKVGETTPPAPIAVKPSDLLGWPKIGNPLRLEDYDGELIQIEGKLLKIQQEYSAGYRLYFETSGTVRFAILPPATPASEISRLQPGSDIRLIGVCVQQLDTPQLRINRTKSVGFHLLLRGIEDLYVLNAPSWWTKERLGWALGSAALTLTALGAWNFTLRRRVAAQARLITEKVANESRLEERQRIGRELHDTLLQELAGITLLIGSTKRHLGDPKKALDTLNMAERMAQRCNIESRSSVQDLMSISLENGGLALAVEELVRPLTQVIGATFEARFPDNLERLDVRLETAVLRITHEAVANAVKHSGASRIEVSLEKQTSSLQLTIRDNGRGFERSTVSLHSPGHFGLLGMEQHAIRVGGRLEIVSTPESGTTVTGQFPLS